MLSFLDEKGHFYREWKILIRKCARKRERGDEFLAKFKVCK
jgi:hypothetical protein